MVASILVVKVPAKATELESIDSDKVQLNRMKLERSYRNEAPN